MMIRLILGFFLAYFLALVGTPMAREAALRFGVVDAPDGQLKNHREPVAYLGGLAVFGAFLLSIGMTFEFDQELLALLLASTIVATVGLIDDFGALTPKPKVIGQVVAVFVLLKAGIMVQVAVIPWWLQILVTIVWLVGMSNAFNLVDILDGLASGLGVIAATFLLVVALLNGRWVVAAFTVALIGALLGFLRSNFAPATIYLGDCGSLFIGLTLGALAMVMDYTQYNPLGFLAPVYILAVPIIDTFYVIVLRLRAGKKIYYGSPDHFPLRVRRTLDGWTAGTVVVSYAVAVVFRLPRTGGLVSRSSVHHHSDRGGGRCRCRPLVVACHGSDGELMHSVVIIGGGLTGLVAGERLAAAGVPAQVLERESEAGGACRSIEAGGYVFDYTGHLLHVARDETREYLERLGVWERPRNSRPAGRRRGRRPGDAVPGADQHPRARTRGAS